MKSMVLAATLILSGASAVASDFASSELERTLDPRGAREIFHLETDDSKDGFSARNLFDPKRPRIDLMFGPKAIIQVEKGSYRWVDDEIDVSNLGRSQAALERALAASR